MKYSKMMTVRFFNLNTWVSGFHKKGGNKSSYHLLFSFNKQFDTWVFYLKLIFTKVYLIVSSLKCDIDLIKLITAKDHT